MDKRQIIDWGFYNEKEIINAPRSNMTSGCIFLLDNVIIIRSSTAEVHTVAEVPFSVVEPVTNSVVRIVDAAAHVAGNIVDIVGDAVVILALISVCIVSVGYFLTAVMVLAYISAVASVDIATARAGCHSEHSRAKRESYNDLLHFFASQTNFNGEYPTVIICPKREKML